MAKLSQDVEISLSYSLFDLPTAQHKAGLAGLLLLIDSMKQRGLSPLPVVSDLTATSVRLTFTDQALQAIFDDLYDAELREVESKAKWPGKAPKREASFQVTDSKTGKVKLGKTFLYDVVVPRVSFLEHHYPGDENGWLKLWRDMIWNTLRSRPTTRGAYEERAEKKPSGEAVATWKELVAFCKGSGNGKSILGELQGSLFIGAQAVNAERVPFNGRVDQNLLLHFWPLTVFIFVPEVIDREGKVEIKGNAYVVSIPEVSDLEGFCDVFPRSIAILDPEMRGYRPRAAIIDLPAEGGLEFLRHLSLIAQQRTERTEVRYSVSAVEVFHLEKRGNNTKMRGTDKLIPRTGLLNQYEAIRRFCRNPFFKSQLIINLLHDAHWYEGFTNLFTAHPWEFFVKSEQTPNSFPWFSSDVRKKFEILVADFEHQLEAYKMQDILTKPQYLEKRIFDMIGCYVRSKTEAKSGVRWAEFKDRKTSEGKISIPPAYSEAKQKICADVFLALRSRRDQDFVEYFAGTICSVPQFLPQDDYIFVSQALLEEGGWEKVKTLSMLALAAHS